jgi:hypothetical protein
MRREPATVRLFAQAAEAAGYDHLAAPDHVLGVNVASRPGGGAGNTAAALSSAFQRDHHQRIASRSLRGHLTALDRYRDRVADLVG